MLTLKKNLLINMVLAMIMATAILYVFHENSVFKRLELFSLDLSFRLKGAPQYNPKINIVQISDMDVAEVGQWPWHRSWHAAVARALTDFGAKAVYFDMLFSEPSNEADDTIFREAIKKSNTVYLPFVYQLPRIDYSEALKPMEMIRPYIKGSGAINIYPDMDGIVRKVPIVFPEADGFKPHIVLRVAMDYRDFTIKDVAKDHVTIGNDRKLIRIPVSGSHQMLLNWSGGWKDAFTHYSYLDVLTSYKDFLEKKPTKLKTSDFKDSICIVGATAVGICDIKSVPIDATYPGVGILATALSNILNHDFIYLPPAWVNIIILYLLAILPAFFMSGERPFREMLIATLIGTLYFFISFNLFDLKSVRLELFTPLFGLFMSSFVIGTYNFIRVAIEKQRFFKMSIIDGLTGLYNISYFKMVLQTEILLARPEREKKFSVVMMDIDHFKNFNDTYGHQTGDLMLKSVAGILKSSVRSLDIVARYGGEEMIILLRGTPLKEAMTVAEKIRKNVEDVIVRDEKNSYRVTISIGVSTCRNQDTSDAIIKRADEGLYSAKEGGRNRVSTIEKL